MHERPRHLNQLKEFGQEEEATIPAEFWAKMVEDQLKGVIQVTQFKGNATKYQ